MGDTYKVIIEPYSTGRVQGMMLKWKATAMRPSDGAAISKCFVTYWGAKRWARKKVLDRWFAEYVDGPSPYI